MRAFLFFIITLVSALPLAEAGQRNLFLFETRAVIVDCDATLIDLKEIQFCAWRHAFERRGFLLTHSEFRRILKKHTLSSSSLSDFDRAIAKFGARKLQSDCSSQLLQDKMVIFENLRLKRAHAARELVFFLQKFAENKHHLNIRLALVSKARKHQVLRSLKRHRIDKIFDLIVTSSDSFCPSGKSHSGKGCLVDQAVTLLGLCHGECAVITDSLRGVNAALDAGCVATQIENNFLCLQDLSRANVTFDSLKFLSPFEFLSAIRNFRTSFEFEFCD